MVPQRPLFQMVTSKPLATPTARAGVVTAFGLLDEGVPYLATKLITDKMATVDPLCQFEKMPTRPFVPGKTKRLLLFFPGGIGDVISLNPCLEDFKHKYPDVELGIVSSLTDSALILPWFDQLWDYPIRRDVAEYYDAWVNIAELDRQSIRRELSDTFAEYLQIEPPRRSATLVVDNAIRNVLNESFVTSGRTAVALQVSSADHYRSLPTPVAAIVGVGLAEEHGCDTYILGAPKDRMLFVDDNHYATGPPEHMHNMCGILTTLEMFIAFIDCMDILLTVDTAAMHIAGALNVSTLAIFGRTDGAKRTQYYPSVSYLQGPMDCCPCNTIEGIPPCEGAWCDAMLKITPDVIAEKLMEVYKNEDSDA